MFAGLEKHLCDICRLWSRIVTPCNAISTFPALTLSFLPSVVQYVSYCFTMSTLVWLFYFYLKTKSHRALNGVWQKYPFLYVDLRTWMLSPSFLLCHQVVPWCWRITWMYHNLSPMFLHMILGFHDYFPIIICLLFTLYAIICDSCSFTIMIEMAGWHC